MNRVQPRPSPQRPRKVRNGKPKESQGLGRASSQSSQKKGKDNNTVSGVRSPPSERPGTIKRRAGKRAANYARQCEESGEGSSKLLESNGTGFPVEPGSSNKREEDFRNVGSSFRLSLIEHHPEKTNNAALAKVEAFSLHRFDELKKALSSVDAFAGALWTNDTPSNEGFSSADVIVVDWDLHDSEMPSSMSDFEAVHLFSKTLTQEAGTPVPNIVYATRRGLRLIWVLKSTITDPKRFRFVALKIAADIGADLGATQPATIYKSRQHLAIFGIHLLHLDLFDADKYVKVAPAWALDGDDELYPKALETFGLTLGQSHSSSKCPLGGHGGNNSTAIKVYPNGIVCFSKHGFIQKARVIKLAGLQSSNKKSLFEIAKTDVTRFAPKFDLISLLVFEIDKRRGKSTDLKILAELLFQCALEEANQDPTSQWSMKLRHFHNGNYPNQLREYCAGRILKQEVYEDTKDYAYQPAYFVKRFDLRPIPRGDLDRPLLNKMACPHFFMDRRLSKDGDEILTAHATPEISRFLTGESTAVQNSSLYDLNNYTRPVVGVQEGWKVSEGVLPCKIVVPRLAYSGTADPHIIREFLEDLKTHFTFENPNMVPQYIGYLIQPMVAHLASGQNPVYFLKGPTHSGKGYLGNVLPGRLYCTQFGPGVCETNFKSGAYELNILISKAAQYPYIFFDEIAYISNKELKFIDNLATQQQLEGRKLHVGYVSVPNHLTVTLAAINKEFSDETKARMVEIALTKSSPNEIKNFNEKWGPRMPELLAALFERVSQVDFAKTIPNVPHRRTGFGVIQMALKDGFGIGVEYPIAQNPNEILDAIVRMHEAPHINGQQKGQWTRYTPKQLAECYNTDNRTPMKAEYMPANLTTALGYQTTEDHPVYAQTGYPGESEKFYHIKIKDEGQGDGRSRRRFIYVRSVELPKDSGFSSVAPDSDIVPQPCHGSSPQEARPGPVFAEVVTEGSDFPVMEEES